MRLLVTGATGHVGSAIVRQAADAGMSVVAVHRGARDPATTPRVTWVRCELTDAGAVRALTEEHGVGACIHAAAVSNEAYAKPAPLAAIASNVGATANLLEAARTAGWRRFVLVSTGSVFQRVTDTTRPILEDQPPAPANVYGTTKLGAELMTQMDRTVYGLSASTGRISWVYGPPIVTGEAPRGPPPSYPPRAPRGVA